MAEQLPFEEAAAWCHLPASSRGLHAKVQLGYSFAIDELRKRKRLEFTVGIDGECIQVYNAKRLRCLTSLAISPRTVITCPPCCLQDKILSSGTYRRFTYAALRDDAGSQKSELVCFLERVKPNNTKCPETDELSRTRYPLRSSVNRRVVHIETIVAKSERPEKHNHDVLVVEDDGQITCLSDGLRRLKWTKKTALRGSSEDTGKLISPQVTEVFCLTTLQAQKSFFRDRQDIPAFHRKPQEDHASSHVLCLITRLQALNEDQNVQRRLYLFHIPQNSDNCSYNLDAMVSWDLPTANALTEFRDCKFAFDMSSSFLHCMSQRSLEVFEFSRGYPRPYTTFTLPQQTPLSATPVPGSQSLIFSKDTFSLVNLRYGTIRSNRRFTLSPTSRPSSSLELIQEADQLTLFACFSALQMVIAFNHDRVVALQFPDISRKRNHSKTTRLVDSLGNSFRPLASSSDISQQSVQNVYTSFDSDDEKWFKVIRTLKDGVEKQSVEQFENTFFETLLQYGIRADAAESKALTNTYQKAAIDRLATQSLHHMFELETIVQNIDNHPATKASYLVAKFLPPRVVQWLMAHHYFNSESIKRALALYRSPGQVCSPLDSSSIIQAVACFDPTLYSLISLSSKTGHLTLPEVVETVKYLIESLDISEGTPSEISTHHPHSQVLEHTIEAEEKAAMMDIDSATALLMSGIGPRAKSLRACLETLGSSFPHVRITEAFRAQLAQQHLMLLIDILRKELECNGWTSHSLDHMDGEYADELSQGQEEALSIICKLLSCALDAVGIGGWLHTKPTLASSPSLNLTIEPVNAVATATLEGVQDSVYFAGFLKDFLRLSASLTGLGYHNSRTRGGVGLKLEANISGNETHEGLKLLPLGQQKDRRVSVIQVLAGGEVKKRSARSIAARLSRRVGRYSFESIHI